MGYIFSSLPRSLKTTINVEVLIFVVTKFHEFREFNVDPEIHTRKIF